jgi:preprotein translocase subunit YajC
MSEIAPSLGLLLLQGSAAPGPSMFTPILLMIVVFYLVLFLPMRRRQKKHDALLASLSAGDKVVTNGGMVGVITALTDKTVTVKLKPDNVKIEFARAAITGLAEKESAD